MKVAAKVLKMRPIAKKYLVSFENERLGLEKCDIDLEEKCHLYHEKCGRENKNVSAKSYLDPWKKYHRYLQKFLHDLD